MKDLMKEALMRKKMDGIHIDIVLPGEHEKEEEDKEAKEVGLAPSSSTTTGQPRLEDDMHEKAELMGLPVKEGDLSDPHEMREAMGKPVAESGYEKEVGNALLGGEEKDQRGSMTSLRDKVKAGIRHKMK